MRFIFAFGLLAFCTACTSEPLPPAYDYAAKTLKKGRYYEGVLRSEAKLDTEALKQMFDRESEENCDEGQVYTRQSLKERVYIQEACTSMSGQGEKKIHYILKGRFRCKPVKSSR